MSDVWSSLLKQALTAQKTRNQPRVAVVGVGHELRGDDAAGVIAARLLKAVLADDDPVLVVEGGSAPENHTGPLRRFAPDLVLLVDTAQMGELLVRCAGWHGRRPA
jgi:hydrogenase 3 maturation protease